MKKLLVLFILMLGCTYNVTKVYKPIPPTTCEQKEEQAEKVVFEFYQKKADNSQRCEYYDIFYYVTSEQKKERTYYACTSMPRVIAVECTRDCNTEGTGCFVFHEDGYALSATYWGGSSVTEPEPYRDR